MILPICRLFRKGFAMKTARDYERMRQAKADKHQALATSLETVEVGRGVLSGPVFNGVHTIRILCVNDGRPVLDFEIDGTGWARVRTARGARSQVARILTAPLSKKGL